MAAGELTPKQQAFVDAYLVCLNATQAAIEAGYSEHTAKQQGSRLLTNADVWAAIQAGMEQRADRMEVSQDDVVSALMAIAFADVRDVAEWGREQDPETKNELPFFRVKPSSELSDEIAVALQSVVIDGQGRLTVKLSDKIRALELLGRHLGMFKRDVDVNVTVGITLARMHELADAAEGDDREA